MSSRQEPITKNIIRHIKHCSALKGNPPSLLDNIYDWLVLGIHTGQRKSEWTNDSPLPKNFIKNIDGSYKAFTAQYFIFKTAGRRHINMMSIQGEQLMALAQSVHITWRYQKKLQKFRIKIIHNKQHRYQSLPSQIRSLHLQSLHAIQVQLLIPTLDLFIYHKQV